MSREPGEAHVLRIGSPSLLNADKSDEKGLMNTRWSLVTLTTAAYMEQCSLEWTGSRETTGEELETLRTLTITVKGHAIQAAGFAANAETGETAEDVAWNNFDQQIRKNP